MNKAQFDVPILLILFNRPNLANQVLNQIRSIQPQKLYITIDGPRKDNLSDAEKVTKCRALVDEIDWPCDVHTLIREENLGCKYAVSSAIDWFFDHVEAGIILEDDCLPDLSFFYFCRELLTKYETDSRVMHIGGANLYGDNKWGESTYFFSHIAHIWGWATWRRAWMLYDVDMKEYPEAKSTGLIKRTVTFLPSRSYWTKMFDSTYSGEINTWDYQWLFTIWNNKGLSIIPNHNLITNIGFGSEATHTAVNSQFSNLVIQSIHTTEIIHPTQINVNTEAVNYAFEHFYQLSRSWKNKAKKLINEVFKL